LYAIVNNDVLLAIPFFTLMGLILERSGMAEDLLDTIGQLFGTVRGGLAYAVVFVGALLAATTGVVAASVISMGLISLPIMLRYGYDRRVATGVIAASGTLAQIIPPSLVLIVMADQLGRSVGDMYEGAFVPGLVLSSLYAGYIFLVARIYPTAAPGLPPEAIGFREKSGGRGLMSLAILTAVSTAVGYTAIKTQSYRGADFVVLTMAVSILFAFFVAVLNWVLGKLTGLRFLSHLAQQVTFVMVPPLFLIFLVLGTIFIGVATPTEGGAMGATGAILLAIFKRWLDRNPNRFNFTMLRSAMEATAKLSAFVVFILVGARIFSLTFYGVNGHVWVEHLLTSLPGGQTGFLVFINILVFLLAFFLDFFEIAFIIIPLLVAPAEKLGIDLIWLGVMLSVNMQTSFMHPPFGFALFYLRSVAPRERFADKVTGRMTEPVTTGQIYWGAVPFVVIQCIMVGLVIGFPQMVMHYKGVGTGIDPSKIEIQIPTFQFPPAPGGLGIPPPNIQFGPPPGLGAPSADLTPPAPAGGIPLPADLAQPAQPATPPAASPPASAAPPAQDKPAGSAEVPSLPSGLIPPATDLVPPGGTTNRSKGRPQMRRPAKKTAGTRGVPAAVCPAVVLRTTAPSCGAGPSCSCRRCRRPPAATGTGRGGTP
jgi:TRAP-type mannitol/chloroaromatic compound transport system permease large subunit